MDTAPCTGPGRQLAPHKQLMKPGLCPVPGIVGSTTAPVGREGEQQREERQPRPWPCWQQAARLSTAPFVLLLVVESLARVPGRVKPPVSLPGDCLHEPWRLEQNQPFLFQGDEWHLESSPPPPRVSVWPCTPGRDTRAPHLVPPPPVTGPPTAQTTLAAPPPGPLQAASTSGQEPWMEKRKQEAAVLGCFFYRSGVVEPGQFHEIQ